MSIYSADSQQHWCLCIHRWANQVNWSSLTLYWYWWPLADKAVKLMFSDMFYRVMVLPQTHPRLLPFVTGSLLTTLPITLLIEIFLPGIQLEPLEWVIGIYSLWWILKIKDFCWAWWTRLCCEDESLPVDVAPTMTELNDWRGQKEVWTINLRRKMLQYAGIFWYGMWPSAAMVSGQICLRVTGNWWAQFSTCQAHLW